MNPSGKKLIKMALISLAVVVASIPGFVYAKTASEKWAVVGKAGFGPGDKQGLAMTTNQVMYVNNDNSISIFKYTKKKWRPVGLSRYYFNNTSEVVLLIAFNQKTGVPYIVLRDDTNSDSGKFSVKSFNGTSWSMVGSEINDGDDVSFRGLSFDNAGTPYIAIRSWNSITDHIAAKLKKFNGTDWVDYGNEFPSIPDGDVDAAFTSDNQILYAAFKDEKSDRTLLNVKKLVGSNWESVGGAIEVQSIEVSDPVIKINPENSKPYIAYREYTNNQLAVLKFENDQWVPVGSTRGIDHYQSYAFSFNINPSNKLPYIAYVGSEYPNDVIVEKFSGTDWIRVGKKRISKAAEYPRIVFSGSKPTVGYMDISRKGGITVQKVK